MPAVFLKNAVAYIRIILIIMYTNVAKCHRLATLTLRMYNDYFYNVQLNEMR